MGSTVMASLLHFPPACSSRPWHSDLCGAVRRQSMELQNESHACTAVPTATAIPMLQVVKTSRQFLNKKAPYDAVLVYCSVSVSQSLGQLTPTKEP